MAEEYKAKHGWWGGVGGGLVVILIGVVFLLRNLGIPLPFAGLHNGWALFIVLGAVPLLVQAAEGYRQARRVTPAVLHSLLSAAAVLLVAMFFLADLDWGIWWPLWLIYGGLWAIVGAGKRRDSGS